MSGLAVSRGMRPRTRYPINTGTSVIESAAAAAIVYDLVKASGENSRPSCASNVKMGRKDSVMTSSEKKRAGPTSTAACVTSSHRSAAFGGRS